MFNSANEFFWDLFIIKIVQGSPFVCAELEYAVTFWLFVNVGEIERILFFCLKLPEFCE